MKRSSVLWLAILMFFLVSLGIAMLDLWRTYRNAQAIAAAEWGRFDDGVYIYAGARLSYDQIYKPPKFLRLPHWKITYDSTNGIYGGTRFITLSEARRYAKPMHSEMAEFSGDTAHTSLVRVGYIATNVPQHPIIFEGILVRDKYAHTKMSFFTGNYHLQTSTGMIDVNHSESVPMETLEKLVGKRVVVTATFTKGGKWVNNGIYQGPSLRPGEEYVFPDSYTILNIGEMKE